MADNLLEWSIVWYNGVHGGDAASRHLLSPSSDLPSLDALPNQRPISMTEASTSVCATFLLHAHNHGSMYECTQQSSMMVIIPTAPNNSTPFHSLHTQTARSVSGWSPRVIVDGRERLWQWLHTFYPRWLCRTILRQHNQSLCVIVTGIML